MTPQPLYAPGTLTGKAYHWRYTWSGWPSSGTFPASLSEHVFRGLDEAWEGDGLRRLEQEWRPDMIQFTFSVKPGVSPVFFAARVKGRLQHAFRLAGMPVAFSRKVAVRTIGKNTRNELEAYIRRQVNSPEEIALGFMNYLAHAFGQKPIWQAGYYVGSFGEYDMGAVRAPRGGEGTRG